MPESYKEDGRPAQQWYWDDWFSAFDVRLCSLAARGLWIDMIGIMFKAEIRGTLTVNGKQINSKTLAKIVGDTIANVNKHLNELEEHDVFSRLGDNTIYCRRLFRESGRQDQISQIRSEAGKKGAEIRWQKQEQKIANMAASTSSPSSTVTSSSENNDLLLKEFNEFWEIYNLKTAKKDALKAFKALRRKGVEFKTIRVAVKGYANHLKNEDWKKQKYPAGFLRNEFWKDFIGVTYEAPL